MTPLEFLALSLAGGFGAVCRLMLDGFIRSRTRGDLPWGTITINITGSLILGLVTGLTGAQVIPEAAHSIAGAGFLGGYTTFSTASFETVRLLQERRRLAAAAGGFGVLVASTAAAAFGWWLAA